MILRGKLRDPPVSDWEEQAALKCSIPITVDTIFVRICHEANTAFFLQPHHFPSQRGRFQTETNGPSRGRSLEIS